MTSTTLLDDRTTTALRDAVAAASIGQFDRARQIGIQALAAGGNVGALNAFLGMVCQRMGDAASGLRHLRLAHQASPGDSRVRMNLASALAAEGEFEEAAALITDEMPDADPSRQVDRLRGYIYQELEQYPDSVRAYERVVASFPDDWETWNNLGNARRCSQDHEGSVAALDRAMALAPDAPPVLFNRAVAIGATGNFQESERLLKELADRFPTEPQALKELHSLYKDQLRDEDALDAIERAVARDPKDVGLRLAFASHLSQTQRYDRAIAAYQEVVRLEPSNGQANLGMSIVYELTNKVDELLAMDRLAKDRGVSEHVVEFIRAFGCRRRKEYEAGLEALSHVPETLESPRRWHLYGQLLQGAGRYDEAIEAFARMNDISKEDTSQPLVRGARYRDFIRKQSDATTPDILNGWRASTDPGDHRTPAFLVGFPRSGTTLLDTMLMGHPEIEVLEEEPTMREAGRHLPEIVELPNLAEAEIQAARDIYWKVASELTPLAPGKLLVDKNPLTMNGLPQLHRLFPDAKIILALRHPCDVVLSCYITNFRANDGMASFLDLDTAAELYALSFEYFERAQAVFNMSMHRVVYERVVADRETELKQLFDFLGLDWHDNVLEHEEIAKGRGRIKTASYSQVIEPIYTRAKGRWWHYRKHLEPIFPTLRPWVEKFGYSLEDPTVIPERKAD